MTIMPDTANSQATELSDDLRAFKHYLQSERGLAANTMLAYGRDLERYSLWVAEGGLRDYTNPTVRELTNYVAYLHEQELAPPSIARHLVALKMFYRFLRMEERAEPRAVELLSSPSLWERIPQVLSPESVEKLLDAPEPDIYHWIMGTLPPDAGYDAPLMRRIREFHLGSSTQS